MGRISVDGGPGGKKEVTVGMVVPETRQEVLIKPGDEWRYFKGTEAPPSDWNQPGFDDSGWPIGPTGIGYSGDIKLATVLDDMVHNYVTFYARRKFRISNPDSVLQLTLGMVYDDGFIAYMSMAPRYAEPWHGHHRPADHVQEPFLRKTRRRGPRDDVHDPARHRPSQSRRQLLSVEVHNHYIGSSDAAMIPRLLAKTIKRER